MLKDFSDLVEAAFPIKDLIPIEYFFGGPGNCRYAVAPFYPQAYLQPSMSFRVHNDVVSFVFDDTLYVIPRTDNVLKILENARFVSNKRLVVPFSNGDNPFIVKMRIQWEILREKARNGKL